MNVAVDNAAPGNWLSRNRRRIAEIGTGHILYATFNWFFDNVLYVAAILQLGLVSGGALMTALSLIQCAASLVLYEHIRIDWVGAGSIAQLAGVPNPAWWQRLIAWATRRGAVVVFLVLCIFQDPFITTAYFRGGRFDGLRSRDWRLFFASVLVSNFYWTLRSGVLAAVVASAWRWVGHG